MKLPRIINNIKWSTALIMLLYCSCVSKRINNDWSRDKKGCLQLRNRDLANKLIKENGLMNGSADSFLKVFGKPDTVNQKDGAESLVYYMKSMCEDNKPVKDSDKCWGVFYFESRRLTSYNFPCE